MFGSELTVFLLGFNLIQWRIHAPTEVRGSVRAPAAQARGPWIILCAAADLYELGVDALTNS